MLPISSSEDCYGFSCALVSTRVLPPLSGAALASLLAPTSAFPLTSREQTHPIAPSPQASHPSGLPRLSPLLRPLDCGGTYTSESHAPGVR